MPAASLSSSTETTATSGRSPTTSGSAGRQRGHPGRVVGAVEDRQRRPRPRPAGGPARGPAPRPPPPSPASSAPRWARRGRHAPRGSSCAGSRAAARRARAGAHDPRAGLARERLDLGVDLAEHERGARPHHGELLARDVGDGRPEPARVLEADVREHDDARVEHVGGVPAPAEAGLDHGDLDLAARELVERRRGQQLELRHALAARRACGRPSRRPPPRARPRRRSVRAGDVLVADPDRARRSVPRCGDR